MTVSVITINYNDRSGLQKTVTSVIGQTYPDIEFIVIDGGSTDGSSEFLKSKENHFSHWISEPDKGIYNAMNKGIEKATGEYLIFLNSGDVFHDEVVITDFVNAELSAELVYGRILFDYGQGKELLEWEQPNVISLPTLYKSSIPHQATFFKWTVFSQYGLYNERFKIVGDWAYNFHLFVKTEARFQFWDRIIAIYDKNGLSSNEEFKAIQTEERNKVLGELFSKRVQDELESLMTEVDERRKTLIPIEGLLKSRSFEIYLSLMRLKNKLLGS